MNRFTSGVIGVDGGEVRLFADHQTDGEMWTGTGDREVRREVRFTETFAAPPSVTLHISLWDFSSETNIRAHLRAEDVIETGFAMVFSTWGDTRVARLRVVWQAIGALPDPEAWDV